MPLSRRQRCPGTPVHMLDAPCPDFYNPSPRQRCRILMAREPSSLYSRSPTEDVKYPPRPRSSRYRLSVSPRRPLWPLSGMTSTPPRALTTRSLMPRSRVRLPFHTFTPSPPCSQLVACSCGPPRRYCGVRRPEPRQGRPRARCVLPALIIPPFSSFLTLPCPCRGRFSIPRGSVRRRQH